MSEKKFNYSWEDYDSIGDLKVWCKCGHKFKVGDVYKVGKSFTCDKCGATYQIKKRIWIKEIKEVKT